MTRNRIAARGSGAARAGSARRGSTGPARRATDEGRGCSDQGGADRSRAETAVNEAKERLCPSCGHPSPPDAQFCRECGAILVRGGAEARSSSALGPSAAPSPAGRKPAGLTPGGSRRLALWTSALAIVALVAVAAHLRRRPTPQIPMPGIPPAGATAAPVVAATAVAAPTMPEASPTPAPTGAPPQGLAPAEPRAARPRTGIEGSVRQRPGWYRMRFRAPLFQEPSETAPIVTYLPEGIRIRVTRALPGFLAVESMTGKPPGYVSSDDATPEDPGRSGS